MKQNPRIYTYKPPQPQTCFLSFRSSYVRYNTQIFQTQQIPKPNSSSPCRLVLTPRCAAIIPQDSQPGRYWGPCGVFLVPHLPYPVSQQVMSVDSHLSFSLQSHCPCFSSGQGFIIFLQGHCLLGLYSPLVVFLSKPFSTSFQHSPSIMPTLPSPRMRLTRLSVA